MVDTIPFKRLILQAVLRGQHRLSRASGPQLLRCSLHVRTQNGRGADHTGHGRDLSSGIARGFARAGAQTVYRRDAARASAQSTPGASRLAALAAGGVGEKRAVRGAVIRTDARMISAPGDGLSGMPGAKSTARSGSSWLANARCSLEPSTIQV